MEIKYNFTQDEALAYQLTGCLPLRIVPTIGEKIANKVDEQIMEEFL